MVPSESVEPLALKLAVSTPGVAVNAAVGGALGGGACTVMLELVVPVARTYALADAREAVAHLMTGHPGGKLALVP